MPSGRSDAPLPSPRPGEILDTHDRLALVRVGLAAVFTSCVVFAVARGLAAAQGASTPWWGNAAGALAIALLWAWWRRAPSERAGAAAHGTAAVALVALLVPVAYGMGSTVWWLSLIGFAMGLMGTRREAWFWGAAVVGAVTLATLGESWLRLEGTVGEGRTEAALARVVFAVVLLGIAFGFRRIVERRTAELAESRAQAERSSQAKTRFLALMSHELRTPLNGVIGMTDLVIRSEVDPTTRARVETAHSSAQLLLRMIQDVLDTARLEGDALQLTRAPFSLHGTLATILAPLAEGAEARGLEFSATAAPELIETREGDAMRVSQIVLNLVSNALKFTERGAIAVRVTPGAAPDAVVIAVRDTGCGIDAAHQQRIFEPFVQAVGSAAHRHAGAGLGLAICQELAQRMEGRIEVDSRVGEGSEFRVTLVLPPAEGATAPGPQDLLARTHAPTPVAAASLDGERLRVLVADDNAINRLVIERMLEALGHEVTLAADGAAALELARSAPFDLLLTDLEMPGLGGVELTRRLREHEAESGARPLPVVAVSAHPPADCLERVHQGGMNGFLSKPFLVPDLSDAIARARAVAPEHGG